MGGGTALCDKALEVGVGAIGDNPGTSADPNVVMDGVIAIDHAICVAAGNLPCRITCTPVNRIPPGEQVTIYYIYGNSSNTISSNSKPTLEQVNGTAVNLTGSDPIINESVNGGTPYSVIKFPSDQGEIYSFVVKFEDTSTGNPVLYGFSTDADEDAEVRLITTGYPNSNMMVVSGGHWDPTGADGDDRVEYETNGGQGNIIEVDTGNNTMKIASTGDRDNRWIGGNNGEGSGASIDFYVAGPSVVDEPLLTSQCPT